MAAVETLAYPHDKIMRRQGFPVLAEPFANHAFHVIAPVGPFGGFFADHQAQACMPQAVVGRLQYLKQASAALISQRKNG